MRSLRILIAEDESLIRLGLRHILEESGHQRPLAFQRCVECLQFVIGRIEADWPNCRIRGHLAFCQTLYRHHPFGPLESEQAVGQLIAEHTETQGKQYPEHHGAGGHRGIVFGHRRLLRRQ